MVHCRRAFVPLGRWHREAGVMRGHRRLDTVLGMQRECGMNERQPRVNFSRLALVGKLEAFSVCGFGIHRWHSRLFVDACILGIV